MWLDRLEEIVQEKKIYGEKINCGVTEADLQIYFKEFEKTFDLAFPEAYVDVLKKVNGIEFNGYILYGIDEKFTNTVSNQKVCGLMEYNSIWHENEWQKKYIFLGESNISWYVFEWKTGRYLELDNPSGRECKEFANIEALVEKVLEEALL